VISPRASLYSSRSILWASEFVLSKWTGADAGPSINKKNWMSLLRTPSGVPDNVESLEIIFYEKIYPILKRDEFSHGCGGSPVNHSAMLDWVPGLVHAPGTLQKPVEGFHRTMDLNCVNCCTNGIWKRSHLNEAYPRSKRVIRECSRHRQEHGVTIRSSRYRHHRHWLFWV